MTVESDLEETLDHLGNVLYFLSDLDPDYRCEALDDAQAFYNAARPNQKVGPSGLPPQIIIQKPFEES